ncbi:MAG: hypothetical protein DRP71_13165 [Verrucomicrobia bacterium]|nr:MAG: hypothetical protein DRP71_13165 [Verrucomicrobiota bacterium]
MKIMLYRPDGFFRKVRSFIPWALLPFLAVSGLSGDALRDDVLEFNRNMRAVISRESTAPPIAARNLAMMHRALHCTILEVPDLDPRASVTDLRSGLAGAGIEMLNMLFPSTSWDVKKVLKDLNAPDPDFYQLGQQVARDVLTERSGDGSSQSITYIPHSKPGMWRRTGPRFRPPELPQWPLVRPFVLFDVSAFRAPPPPALDSPEYASDWNEVRLLGARDSETRTADQAEIARFWSYFSYTGTPPGVWNQIAALLAESRDLGGVETIELFCVLNLALADAGIVAHDTKFHYNFWRPLDAIHRADEDGNPSTRMDPDWIPMLEEPPHPEYVSGHSTFSGAGAEILSRFFGTEDLSFNLTSESFPDQPRHFSNPWEAAREAGRSRVFGGIHYEFSNRVGLEAGRRVADYVLEHHEAYLGGCLNSPHEAEN